MAYRPKDDKAYSKDPKIITAVEFLNDVHGKGHKESELRKYLVNRRQLTHGQVDEALRIHNIRVEKNMVDHNGLKRNADRREVSTGVEVYSGPRYLRAEKRVVGLKLIKDFLRTEYNYLGVIECLHNEYYRELCLKADMKKIVLTRSDLHDIFQRIPNLLDFHKVFYQNIKNPKSNIAQEFLRVFSNFKIYIEYMKDCTCMINKMRVHIHDKKLRRVLEQIRGKSKRLNDCMVDLLLVPLDRITDYKEFLDRLYDWGDKNQGVEYVNLGKASRRIGRIADYIGKYKGGIINRNEMNRVQQFLESQCNILNNKRRIIRRGVMTRRTTGWPARKKKYIFFLFSDLLLWTSRKGELQNVVRHSVCEVLPSDAKNNRELKFKIISAERNRVKKTLLLECNQVRQRNQWFTAVSEAIENAKRSSEDESGMKTIDDDFKKFLTNSEPDPMFTTPPPYSKNTVDHVKNEDSRTESVLEDDSDIPTSGPWHRYNLSQNFPNGEFLDEFGPLDDTASVTSEDQEPYSRRGKYGASMHQIFPNMVSNKSIRQSDANKGLLNYQEDLMNTSSTPTTNPFYKLTNEETKVNEGYYLHSGDEGRLQRKTPTHANRSLPNLSIIRREKDDFCVKSEPMLETGSSFTIRLGSTAY